MEHVYEPNKNFVMNDITMTPPIALSGGNYLIKYLIKDNPLYIQSPKCTTKVGIVKCGKKLFFDLLFTNENGEFIQWLEDLENYSQECIFQNRSDWFESDIDSHDIENSFTSTLKVYKSGKFYILRTLIPSRLGKSNLKIFDEDEIDVDIDTIKESTNVIAILEFQGVQSSVRSFQIDIEIKQMMVLKPSKIFDKCIIRSNKPLKEKQNNVDELKIDGNLETMESIMSQKEITPITQENEEMIAPQEEIISITQEKEEEEEEEGEEEEEEEIIPTSQEEDIMTQEKEKEKEEEKEEEGEKEEEIIPTSHEEEIMSQNDIVTQDHIMPKEIIVQSDEQSDLLEIDFDLGNLNDIETIQIKQRSEVYYKIYQDAINKAKEARALAISAYLDAKQIQKLYMLDEIDDIDEII